MTGVCGRLPEREAADRLSLAYRGTLTRAAAQGGTSWLTTPETDSPVFEMAGFDRVTVTLPSGLLRDFGRREKNRSKFIAEAVRNELDPRRRDDPRRSLEGRE